MPPRANRGHDLGLGQLLASQFKYQGNEVVRVVKVDAAKWDKRPPKALPQCQPEAHDPAINSQFAIVPTIPDFDAGYHRCGYWGNAFLDFRWMRDGHQGTFRGELLCQLFYVRPE